MADTSVLALPVAGNTQAHPGYVDERGKQGMVLVGNVEVMEDPKSFAVPTLIRLGSVDGVYRTLRRQLICLPLWATYLAASSWTGKAIAFSPVGSLPLAITSA